MTKPSTIRWPAILGLFVLCLTLLETTATPNPIDKSSTALVARSPSTTASTSTNTHVVAKQCGQDCASCASRSHNTTRSESKRGNISLDKRLLSNPWGPPWNGDIEQYLTEQILQTRWFNMDSIRGGKESVAWVFELRNTSFTIGMGFLSGCVAVYVISNAAIYIAHHWEVSAFSPGDWKIGTPEVFKKMV